MSFLEKGLRAFDGRRIVARGDSKNRYAVKIADSEESIRAAQVLRFLVFNLELNEGLDASYDTLTDADEYDAVCDHLLVEDRASGEVVGTYRLQTGTAAGSHLGYYSASEFDLTPFDGVRSQTVELGRACVHRDHRNLSVLSLLWRGIIEYARDREARYLIGCSSLSSQNEDEGMALYHSLRADYLAPDAFITKPLPDYQCHTNLEADAMPKVRAPRLLAAYLAMGARICGEPAIDRQFRTIDFLTFIDLGRMDSEVLQRLGVSFEGRSTPPVASKR